MVVNRKPYSIHTRRDWVPVTAFLVGVCLGVLALVLIVFAMVGEPIR